MTISQIFLPEFDEEMKNTRKVLERIPDGKFDYKPHQKSMPLGRLAGHIAEFPSWAKSTLEIETLTIPPDFKPWEPKNRQEVLDRFDKNLAEARPFLERATDEDFGKIWTLIWQGNPVISMPRSAVLRSVVMNHMIHHRAQLGVYLRLNEIPVPGAYGPSADEMEAMSAQKA